MFDPVLTPCLESDPVFRLISPMETRCQEGAVAERVKSPKRNEEGKKTGQAFTLLWRDDLRPPSGPYPLCA